MALEAFFDDSNYTGKARRNPALLIYAGYVAEESEWRRFDADWNRCLEEDPAISYFKMSEAMAGEGEFSLLSEPIRNFKINQLYKIIARYTLVSTLSIVVLDDFEEVMRTENGVPEPLCNPHFFSYYGIVQNVGAALKYLNLPGPVSLVFDDGNPMSKEISAAWESFKTHGPVPSGILSGSPTFSSDTCTPPLQAADYFAWVCTRKVGYQYERQPSPSYPWEKDISPKCVVPNVWNKENLRAYLARCEERRLRPSDRVK